jgi:hypothetical protein
MVSIPGDQPLRNSEGPLGRQAGTYAPAPAPKPTSKPKPKPKSPDNPLSGAQRDAFLALENLFKSYGLESLVDNIKQYVIQGYSADTIQILLTESKEYKERFAANEARRKAGLRVLSPAEYIQTENQYQNMMRAYGLPRGFYDSRDDFRKFLENDVAPAELEQRVQAARATVLSDDEMTRQTYKNWYAAGLNEGDAIAAILDPNRALPEIEKKARAAALGSAASRQGVGTTASRAEELAGLGVSAEDAMRGYGQVADIQRNAGTVASRYGMEYQGQRDAEDAVFLNNAAAAQRIKKLGQREAAEFGGRGVGDSRSLGRGSY